VKVKKLLVLLLVIISLTVACETQGPSGNRNPYRGGVEGVSIQFALGAPPDEVFDGSTYPFDIEVELVNRGEADVAAENVKIILSGINPLDFGKVQQDFIRIGIQEPLLATKIDAEGNILPPPPVYVTFPNLAYKGILPGNNLFPVRADICYTYKTEAFADGCIRADVLSTRKDAVCQITEVKQVFNSASPIQIVEFRQMPSGSNKVRYVFKILHKPLPTGRFFLPNSGCPSDVSGRQSENKVYFKIGRIEDHAPADHLVCTGISGGTGTEGEVRLVNGEATITCTQQTASETDYVDKLFITLTYDYRQFAERPLLVKKSIN
jgi:hypothetical protein